VENCIPQKNSYLLTDGWEILFGDQSELEKTNLKEKLDYTLERCSKTLHGIL
jgi:hypothetical protein